MSEKPYSVTTDRTGLSFGYRPGWRLAYMVTFVTGSANRQGTIDPSTQLRRERALRLVETYRARGQESPAGALRNGPEDRRRMAGHALARTDDGSVASPA